MFIYGTWTELELDLIFPLEACPMNSTQRLESTWPQQANKEDTRSVRKNTSTKSPMKIPKRIPTGAPGIPQKSRRVEAGSSGARSMP